MFIRFLPLLSVMTMLFACSEAVTWTAAEIENGERVYAAINASNEASQLMRRFEAGESNLKPELIEKLQEAHVQAVLVNDVVLDKLHPSMHLNFRNKFQRSLGKLVRYYKGDKFVDISSASDDMAAFQAWFMTHQPELRRW